MLHLIEISWTRRCQEPGRSPSGTTTYAEFARSLNAAITKAKNKFRLHYGMHCSITAATEKPDPAKVFEETRHDCGSGYDHGICPACGRGHGFLVFSNPAPKNAGTC